MINTLLILFLFVYFNNKIKNTNNNIDNNRNSLNTLKNDTDDFNTSQKTNLITVQNDLTSVKNDTSNIIKSVENINKQISIVVTSFVPIEPSSVVELSNIDNKITDFQKRYSTISSQIDSSKNMSTFPVFKSIITLNINTFIGLLNILLITCKSKNYKVDDVNSLISKYNDLLSQLK